jgi:hypothetical protein
MLWFFILPLQTWMDVFWFVQCFMIMGFGCFFVCSMFNDHVGLDVFFVCSIFNDHVGLDVFLFVQRSC